MAWAAKGVANYLLDLAERDGRSVDPLQMQKLLFFVDGWHLALFGEPAVAEQFEAWQRGPVVPVVYHSFKHYGFSPIAGRLYDFDIKKWEGKEVPRPESAETLGLIEEVWDVYKRYSGSQLVALTHEKGSPWEETWTRAGGAPDARIEKESIKRWFKQKSADTELRNSQP